MDKDAVQQLAHLATVWCEKHAKGSPVAWEWEMKFAELIVQECIHQIDLEVDYCNTGRWAVARIQERFGLK